MTERTLTRWQAEYINPRINIRFNYRLIDYYCVNIQNIRAGQQGLDGKVDN